MRLRDRLGSPWVSATLAVLLVALAGIAAVATGAVRLPALSDDLFATPTPDVAAASTPTPIPLPTGPTAEPTFTRPTPSPEPSFVTYRVAPGDTLTSIAKRFKTTARSIAWWNRGTYPSLDPESPSYKPNRIEVGWLLVLLPGAVVDENNPPTPSPQPVTDATPAAS
jgi:hypothetical protein